MCRLPPPTLDDVIPASDAAQIAAAADGSRDALAALYERHGGTVYALALRMLGNPSDAEDVLQDVFVGLPQALRRYEERGTFAAWLRLVTARAALARRRHLRPMESLDPTLGAPRTDLALRVDLEAALARLPDSLRIPFILRAVEGLSHGEIGALLELSPANAMQRFSRACKLLRGYLDRGP